MSSPKRLFEKTASKRPRRDSDDKQELSPRQNVGRNVSTPSAKKPAFNPALLSSAFYSGPTMYGGAGASNSSPYNQYAKSKFYDRKKTDIKVTPSTPVNSMSQTSRRILDLLEQYSSPISDAKRVPTNKPPLSHSTKKISAHQSFLDSTVRSSPQENSTPGGTKSNRFRELQIPSMATLMKMKRNNCTMSSPQTSITASLSSSLPYKPDSYSIKTNADAGNHKNKIRTKINRRADRFCDEELPEPVNLPNISLNMTGVKLPTFTMQPFNTPYTNTKQHTAVKRSEPISTDSFKFSSPLNHGNAEIVLSTKKFFFRDPLDILSSKYGTSPGRDAKEVSPFKTRGEFNSPIAGFAVVKNKSNICGADADLIKNKMDNNDELSLKHLGRRPAESWNGNDKSGSKDVDKSSALVNGDVKKDEGKGRTQFNNNDNDLPSIHPKVSKTETPHSELANLIKKQKSQWECSTCMTRNDDDKIKCVCCEASKPGGEVKKVEPARNTLTQSSSGLADFMKKQSAQWECSSCMSRNDNDKLKCVCCEAPKPGGATKQTSNTLPSVYPGMVNFMKKQNSQWECSSCMTRNDDNRTKCVCCEATKPGCEPEKSGANFNFGSPQTANIFKFGIDQADGVTKFPLKDTKTVSEVEKKPSVPAISAGFVFGNAAATEVKADTPKVGGFTFGIANGTPVISKESTPSVPVSIFGEKKDTPAAATTPATAPPPYSFVLKKPEVESNNAKVSSSTSETKTNTITFSSPKSSVNLITSSETKKEPEKLQVSFGSQLSGSQLLTSSKLPVPSVSSTTNVAPTKSPAPAFTFGSPQTTKPGGGFGGNSPFQFGAASTTTAAAPVFKPTAAATFSFGSKDTSSNQLTSTKTTDSVNSGADALFRIPPANTSSLFSVPASISSTNQDALKDKITKGNISSGISFPSVTPVVSEKPKANPTASPFFSFGAAAPDVSSAGANPGLFKPATSAAPVFSFGSNITAKTDAGSVPIFGSVSSAPVVSLFGTKPQAENKIVNSPSAALFKPAPSSITSPFAASSSNLFGSPPVASQPPSGAVFGTNPLGQTTNKPPSGIFGAPSTASPAASLFPGSGAPSSGFGGGNIFGSASRTNQIAQPAPGPFGAQPASKPSIPESGGGFMSGARSTPSASLFSASPSPAVPPPAGGGLFGSSSASPVPVFGAPIPFGEGAQSHQPSQNVAFKFGAPSSTMSPAMGFGQPSAPAPSPMFSFGSQSTQPPPSGSQFNFSMGAQASGFAPGVNPNGQQRKIKKAVRRTMR